MTKITATFSDGTVKTYTGARDVKAAYCLTLPKGTKVYAWAKDRQTAAKSSSSRAREGVFGTVYLPRGHEAVAARRAGFKNAAEAKAHNNHLMNEFEANCSIEIVETSIS